MDQDKIRVLLVGVGIRGKVWARVCHESSEVTLAGVVDRDQGRARSVVASLESSTVSVFADLDDALLAGGIDAVILATPPDTHYSLAVAALDAGCHVLCEKPVSDKIGEVVDLVKRAEDRDLHLLVGMNFRYLSTSQKIRQIVRSEELGKLSYAQFAYVRHRDGNRDDLNDYPLTMAYPMLWEQSVHHFDLLRYCYATEVEELVAESFRPPWSSYEGDCCVSVLFRFANGLRVNYLGTWTAAWNNMRFNWRSEFSSGVLIQKRQFDDLSRAVFRPELARAGSRFKTAEDAEPLVKESLDPCVPFVDDSRGLLDELVGAIRGSAAPITTGRDHLLTLSVVQACIDSFEQRRWVQLAELHEKFAVS